MEILGIGPGEFVLILILLLVVVGPERLPGLARQAASILVRIRNWLQTSPDAALVLRARQEIEAELASLKLGLLEVQNVRDEVLGAAKQLEESVGSLTSTKLDVKSLINAPVGQTIARDQSTTDVPPPNTPDPLPSASTNATTPAAPPKLDQVSTSTLRPNPVANQLASQRIPTSTLSPAELEVLNTRLEVLMADLWALQTQLKARGVLDDSWQLPSASIQFPADAAATTETASNNMDGEASTPIAHETDAAAESRLLASAAAYVALTDDTAEVEPAGSTSDTIIPDAQVEADTTPDITAKDAVAPAPEGTETTPTTDSQITNNAPAEADGAATPATSIQTTDSEATQLVEEKATVAINAPQHILTEPTEDRATVATEEAS